MCFRPPSFDEMMKKCPSCGSFNPPELTKCKKCGTDLPEAAGGTGDASMPAPGAPKGPGAPPGARCSEGSRRPEAARPARVRATPCASAHATQVFEGRLPHVRGKDYAVR
ncbi:hypothetical protein [Raoultibacter timonensis]|uniref:Zinc ribbon protein n=1 Tax=Raoultibacter timonensis TaxID=1907662 RepID=A0ABN6MFT3_9ACTN|nr:hypothetical protein [Raoultibacter timonensis]BDE95667.1 hypothetical protein CE91St30_10000 [Raoultibacter timonensis]BDF50271.1 hypothetical protein CE91St31_10010 [Raoultibacter timonensis]